MPALPKKEHEAFASLVANGETPARAYVLAGYKVTSPDVARANASKLLRKASVMLRVQELQPGATQKLQAKLEAVTDKLISDKAQRIQTYEDDFAAIMQLRRERAADANRRGIAGIGTGLVAVQDDKWGSVARFDAALIREARELRKQIAIEQGEWTEKSDIKLEWDGDLEKLTPAQRSKVIDQLAKQAFGDDPQVIEAERRKALGLTEQVM